MPDDPEMDARYGFARRPPAWKPNEDEWLKLFLNDDESPSRVGPGSFTPSRSQIRT